MGGCETVLPAKVPTFRLDNRRLTLHLESVGVDRWDKAVVELWLTRDGWSWQRYQHETHGDSLFVSLPEQGRYGVRLVVHDLDAPPSPRPLAGDAPQLWVQIDETLPSVPQFMKTQVDRSDRCVCSYVDWPVPGVAEKAKAGDIPYPRAHIKRVETEKIFTPNYPRLLF